MESLPPAVDLAAFDEIVDNLKVLSSTLDHVVESSVRFKVPRRPIHLAVCGRNEKFSRKLLPIGTDNDINQKDEEKLRSTAVLPRRGDPGSRNGLNDNVIGGQTQDYSGRVLCGDLLEAKMRLENKEGFSEINNSGIWSGNTNRCTRNIDVTQTDGVTLQEYLSSDPGNCTTEDKAESQSKALSANKVSPSYLPNTRINEDERTKYFAKTDTAQSWEGVDCQKDRGTENEVTISRSSKVIASAIKKEGTSRNNVKIEGRSRSHDEEVEKKFIDDTLPFPSRTSSLKRAINKKLAPFWRPKPKLKPVRSLPVDKTSPDGESETFRSFRTSNGTSPESGNPTTSLFDQTLSSNDCRSDNIAVNSNNRGHGPPSCRRARSLDSGETVASSVAPSTENIPESEDSASQSPEPSLFCYKKRKPTKRTVEANDAELSPHSLMKGNRSASKLNGTSPVGTETILPSHQFHAGADRRSISRGSDHNNNGTASASRPRHITSSSAFKDVHSLELSSAKTNSREACNKSVDEECSRSKGFSDRDSANFRRSTIGSSYLRETGLSASNIYQNGLNYTERPRRLQSLKNQHRHSLQVFKEQKAVSPSKNENRWSTEDKLVKATQFFAQTQDHDKNFAKGSGIKPKSIFQKSTKSSKSTAMSSADLDKLTERTWNSVGKCVWANMNGQRVELAEIDLLRLSESECVALQKIAAQRLHDIDLGVSITIPKDESKLLFGKNNNSILKRHGVHLPLGAKSKYKKEKDHVFSIPLVRVVENDQLLRLQTDEALCSGNANDDDSLVHSSSEPSPKPGRRMSSSQDSSTTEQPGISPTVETADGRTSSPATTPNDSPASRRKAIGGNRVGRTLKRRGGIGLDTNTEIDSEQSKLLESLMLSESSTRALLPPTMPQVPYVVQKCCAHIRKHGLDVTGIFRIAGSKKRVRQLREEFDLGVDVKIADDYNSHDVAALLKEFFRDLPEALLTRELYQAFITTAKLPESQRLHALRCLVWLLPMPNRDTLQQLLSFLAIVAEHSEDRVDGSGNLICGNKMGVVNLSTIFGPNILHRNKKTGPSTNDAQYQVQSMERAEESTFVINVVDGMVKNHEELFLIPKETHDEILRNLQESDPGAVDYLLRRKAANYLRTESCPSPSEQTSEDGSTFHEIANLEAVRASSEVNNNSNNSSNESGHDGLEGMRHKHFVEDLVPPDDLDEVIEVMNSSHLTPPSSRSISFTDEDLKDILRGEIVTKNTRTGVFVNPSANKHPGESVVLKKTFREVVHHNSYPNKQHAVSESTKDGRHDPRGHLQYSRRQAFSLDTHVVDPSRNGKEDKLRKGSGKTRREGAYEDILTSTTSGFVDMTSNCEGEDISTVFENTSCVVSYSNNPSINTPEKESNLNNAIRKRLPSALNLRINRTHGGDPSKSMHALRLPKRPVERKSEENGAPLGAEDATACDGFGRRVSKDDMFLTLQQFRRRNERRRNIII